MANQIKTIEDFTLCVKNCLTETFPGCKIYVKTVTKDNGLCLTGIVICPKNTTFAPIIYLNSYFDRLQAGTPLPDILDGIANDYEAGLKEAVSTNIDEIKDFSLIKNKICYRLVNKESNSKLLSAIPYRDFYNMAVIYYVNLTSTDRDLWTVKVTNNLADLWGVDEAQLYALASKNTPTLERGCITPLCDTIKEITGLPVENDNDRLYIPFNNFNMTVTYENDDIPMYVVTNISKTHGAGVILYDGLLKSVSRILGNFFILPSSIHECITVSGEREDAESLINIVKEVNATVVSDEEVLSNNCLYYNAKSHTLEMIK